MKNVAVLILMVMTTAALLQPITEFGVLLNEKIKTGAAVTNAMEVAGRTGLVYEDLRNMDATIDQTVYVNEFVDAFEAAMDVSLDNHVGSVLTFRDLTGERNDFVVNLSFLETTDPFTSRTTSSVLATVASDYKFKTNLLQQAAAVSTSMDFTIVTERRLLLNVKN